ncbi:MAG: hypothetical protein ABIX28_17565 [Vicinamibacterales bacterium]
MIACAMALAIAVPSLRADVRSAPGPQDRWNRFSADLTIRRVVLPAGGDAAASTTPATTYRWERVQSGPRWKTTMEVKGSGRAPFVTPTGALQEVAPVVARIEDDGGEEGPRFYGLDGKRLRLPTIADRRQMGLGDELFAKGDPLLPAEVTEPRAVAGGVAIGREWVDALLPTLDKRGARAQRLQRRFGLAKGKWKGRDRYLEVKGDDTTEVLIDPTWSVPVEINVARAGVLRSHATFTYEPGPGGSMLRKVAHVERAIDEGAGKSGRMVMDVELANVRLEERK